MKNHCRIIGFFVASLFLQSCFSDTYDDMDPTLDLGQDDVRHLALRAKVKEYEEKFNQPLYEEPELPPGTALGIIGPVSGPRGLARIGPRDTFGRPGAAKRAAAEAKASPEVRSAAQEEVEAEARLAADAKAAGQVTVHQSVENGKKVILEVPRHMSPKYYNAAEEALGYRPR